MIYPTHKKINQMNFQAKLQQIKNEVDVDEEVDVEVYKLVTTSWVNDRGLHLKKSLILQKRLSSGYQILYEDAIMDSESIGSITNLLNCKDGFYFIKTINVSRDYETGYIDSYDYELVPLEYQP
jgi:hypothetical protein